MGFFTLPAINRSLPTSRRRYSPQDFPEHTIHHKGNVHGCCCQTALRPNRKTMFNGKICIWPFVMHEPAKQNSKNRVKENLAAKGIPKINRHETGKMLVENFIPAIKNKWPKGKAQSRIIIQQDNAKPHLQDNDAELIAECQKNGWYISFRCQPPNSPDFNVLDLGFFNSVEALQHQNAPKSIDDLIECVHK